MKKYIYILLSSLALMVSCEEDVVIYDGVNGQTYARFSLSNVALPVIFDSSADTEIPVQLSTLSSTDRTVGVEVVITGAENEASPDQYQVGNTVVIPANSYAGNLAFTGIDNGIEIGETKTVTLRITEISEDPEARLDALSQTTVSMFQVCPVETDFFIGDYVLETVTPGLFNSTVFPQGVVTLEQSALGADARKFSAFVYPEFGEIGPIEFNFILVCGTVAVPGGQSTPIGCSDDGTTVFGPQEARGEYSAGDDSVLIIDFSDDIGGDCGGPIPATIRLTKV